MSAPAAVLPEERCVSLIGMAASGKSKMGAELARMLNWAHVDADHLMEAAYGSLLQSLVDALSRDDFLDLESTAVRNIRLQRCIISTGGSVVYRRESMEHLKNLGPVLYIEVSLPVILERISRKPDRGLVIGPGQSLEDLFNERRLLYEKYADLTVRGGNGPVHEYAGKALALILQYFSRGRGGDLC
ncbi:MAG: shikimate kinase [Deltaproteobacteria bacterium]|jgi:shikimate kinase|nr:shikimate kinase [Deltaproteobacteria bacterium]